MPSMPSFWHPEYLIWKLERMQTLHAAGIKHIQVFMCSQMVANPNRRVYLSCKVKYFSILLLVILLSCTIR